MSSNNSESFGGVLFIATIALAVWLSDWVPFRNDVTVYQANCSVDLVDGACPRGNWMAGKKVSFKPIQETKTVVYWQDGEAPNKYDNCAIVDVKNWSCSGHYASSDHMVDGAFGGLPIDGAFSKAVSKWEWWWLKFKNM
jgi:hypothetical protein